MATSARVRAFDAMRGLAIIAVGVIHSSGFAWNPQARHTELVPYMLVRQLSGYAVPLFVFLSGYLLAQYTFLPADYGKFMRKRLTRLIPPYLLWSLIAIALDAAAGKTWNASQIYQALLYGQASVPCYFVPMIMQLYITLPAWIALARHKWLNIALALVISGGLWLYYLWLGQATRSLPWWYMLTAGSWLLYFVVGLQWRQLSLSKVVNSQKSVWWLLAVCVAASTALSVSLWDNRMEMLATSSLRWDSAIVNLIIVWLLMHNQQRLNEAPKWLVRLGRNSFFAYLTHALLLHIFGRLMMTAGWYHQLALVKMIMLTALSIGIPAWVSWRISALWPNSMVVKWIGAGC